MVALVAVMRKLLYAMYGMSKHQQALDGPTERELLPPQAGDSHRRGRRLMPKRKVSCTFKRERFLLIEIQGRILLEQVAAASSSFCRGFFVGPIRSPRHESGAVATSLLGSKVHAAPGFSRSTRMPCFRYALASRRSRPGGPAPARPEFDRSPAP